jgi:hypothetical protein
MRDVTKTPARHASAAARFYLSRRYAVLFYTLLLTLVAAPLAAATEWEVLIEVLLAFNLLAAVAPAVTGKRRRLFLAFVVAAWLARPATGWFELPVLSTLSLGGWTLIGLVAAGAVLRFALRATHVDAEHLYAALSAYLLAGIFFGLLYWVVDQLDTAAFLHDEFSQMSAIYFSFVTLATLGYGDIVPHSDVARGIAMVEGIGGQLFLAVLVARLVSLYSRRL